MCRWPLRRKRKGYRSLKQPNAVKKYENLLSMNFVTLSHLVIMRSIFHHAYHCTSLSLSVCSFSPHLCSVLNLRAFLKIYFHKKGFIPWDVFYSGKGVFGLKGFAKFG